jgi:hypothetical protein
MTQTAAHLRAQKTYSTDPEYLERMAIAVEAREAHVLPPATQFDCATRSSPDQSKKDQ